MIFTDLTYTNVGNIIAMLMMIFFSLVVMFRFFLAFRKYVYTGKFADAESSWCFQALEHNKYFSKYLFTGEHIVLTLLDFSIWLMFALLAIPLWGVYVVGGLVILLAIVMRKRIAPKQEFVDRLKGEHL